MERELRHSPAAKHKKRAMDTVDRFGNGRSGRFFDLNEKNSACQPLIWAVFKVIIEVLCGGPHGGLPFPLRDGQKPNEHALPKVVFYLAFEFDALRCQFIDKLRVFNTNC